MTKAKVNKFLKELAALTKKYNLVIGGCGCCGSPFVDVLGENEQEGYYDLKVNIEGDSLLASKLIWEKYNK